MQPNFAARTVILFSFVHNYFFSSVMGVQKPRKDPATGLSPATRYPLLEEQLVNLFIKAMDEAEEALERNPEGLDPNLSLLWWNLSSELIFFLLYQFVTFPTFVDSIHKALNTV